MSEADFNLQFDLEGSLSEIEPYVARMIAETSLLSPGIEIKRDLRYGLNPAERLDLYLPLQCPAPLFFFVHGGWWRSQSKESHACFARGMVNRGYAVAMPEYTLCPKNSVPGITDELRSALAWLHQNATKLGIDAERIIFSGHSAGGQQAAMACLPGWTSHYGLPKDVVKGAIAISGLFDMRPFRFSWLQASLQLDADSAIGESPMLHITPEMPPQLVTLGGHESIGFHLQSSGYVEAAKAQGVHCEVFAQPGCNHITALYGLFDADSALCAAIDTFSRSCFRVPTGVKT